MSPFVCLLRSFVKFDCYFISDSDEKINLFYKHLIKLYTEAMLFSIFGAAIGFLVMTVKNDFKTKKIVACLLVVVIFIAGVALARGYSKLVTYHRSINPVPYLFVSCLSDEAVLSNHIISPLLATDARHSKFQRLNVSTSQRSSAQFALLNYESYDLPRSVLAIAYKAYVRARSLGLDKQQILTVVDYEKPSNARRLWVFDMKHNKILYHTFVAHGIE